MRVAKQVRICTVLTAVLAAPVCLAAQPGPFAIDQFAVTKTVRTANGPVQSTVIDDSFADGIPPPTGPDGAGGVYLIRGFPWPAASEVGGKLHFSPGGAVSSVDPEGRTFLTQRARLATSTEQGASGGLRNNGVFSVSGVFDLAAPMGFGAGYGIGLTDSADGELGNDALDLMVQRNQGDQVVVQLARRDWQTHQTVLFQEFAVDFSQGDQIKLALLKSDGASNAINGFFQYLDGGVAVGSPTAFNVAPVIFRGEDTTRAQFQAVFVVPEPETWLLFAAGLAMLAAVKRGRGGRSPA